MKVITSAALFNAGILTPTPRRLPQRTPSRASPTTTTRRVRARRHAVHHRLRAVLQQRVHQQWPHLSGALANTAKDYYGLNQKWDIGIGGLSASYFNAPASASGAELAQEASARAS